MSGSFLKIFFFIITSFILLVTDGILDKHELGYLAKVFLFSVKYWLSGHAFTFEVVKERNVWVFFILAQKMIGTSVVSWYQSGVKSHLDLCIFKRFSRGGTNDFNQLCLQVVGEVEG